MYIYIYIYIYVSVYFHAYKCTCVDRYLSQKNATLYLEYSELTPWVPENESVYISIICIYMNMRYTIRN